MKNSTSRTVYVLTNDLKATLDDFASGSVEDDIYPSIAEAKEHFNETPNETSENYILYEVTLSAVAIYRPVHEWQSIPANSSNKRGVKTVVKKRKK